MHKCGMCTVHLRTSIVMKHPNTISIFLIKGKTSWWIGKEDFNLFQARSEVKKSYFINSEAHENHIYKL